jgi:hypothetical protein
MRDTIEVATGDGPVAARLSAGKGLTLESREVLVGRLKAADLPAGSFGPLRFRLVGDDMTGDWRPLATLVRLPRIENLTCEANEKADTGPCTLSGRDLFLVDAVAAEPAFAQAVKVPSGFTGSSLAVPRPLGGKLYLRLRDAPGTPVALSQP